MPDELMKERLRNAVRQSFYACTDSVFFDESMSEDDHEKMLTVCRRAVIPDAFMRRYVLGGKGSGVFSASAARLQTRREKLTSFCPLIETGPLSITVYSTFLILGLSLNFGQFDKLIASKLLISFPVICRSQSLISNPLKNPC